MTKRKPAKLTENERLHILLSISERSVQNLLKTPEWEQISKLTADYRKLESENSRLRSLDSLKTVALADSIHTCSRGCKKSGCNRGLRDTIDELKAENERLRKAGDRMAAALNGDYNHELDCVKEWNAAKQPPTDPV